jgi:hypothetical protein
VSLSGLGSHKPHGTTAGLSVTNCRAHNKPSDKVVHMLVWLDCVILMGSEIYVDFIRISVVLLLHRFKLILSVTENKICFCVYCVMYVPVLRLSIFV